MCHASADCTLFEVETLVRHASKGYRNRARYLEPRKNIEKIRSSGAGPLEIGNRSGIP